MLSYFCFGGKSSLDYGIKISSPSTLSGAEREITVQQVPGRNGALLIDSGYYNNLDISYDTWIKVPSLTERAAWARRLKGWLLSQPAAYRELYDSYDGNYCRMACYSGGLEITTPTNRVVQQTLTFTSKPFAYLRDGLRLREIKNKAILINPHQFPARPYIKITGSGDITLQVGNRSWKITGVDGYVELDCERMSTYKGTQALNDRKEGEGYPILPTGSTGVSWGGDVSKLEIMPRWCTL